MKRSSEFCATEAGEAVDLELPVFEHRGLPPLVSMAAMMRRIEELRRAFPEGIPSAEERLERKSMVPFEL